MKTSIRESNKSDSNLDKNLTANIENTINRIRSNQFKGWDPYDILNSECVSKRQLSRATKVFLTQSNRISPLNLRSFMGVNKIYNSKAMALFLSALLNINEEKKTEEERFLVEWLLANKNDTYDGYTIGFTYDITLRGYSSGPGEPSLIITLFVMYAFIQYYLKTGDQQVANQIFSFKRLIENELPRVETDKTLCYSYHFHKFSEVYNATAKIGKFYALLYSLTGEELMLKKLEKILNYLSSNQRPDGSWEYAVNSYYTDGFHTAFVLEAITYMLKYIRSNKHEHMFKAGLQHYEEHLLKKGRQPIHYHRSYPPQDPRRFLIETDIRDCAMGIIFFSKIGRTQKAAEIMEWTLNNMYNARHNFFYYYKNRLWSNKIEFVRWQAWMLYALSVYGQSKKEIE